MSRRFTPARLAWMLAIVCLALLAWTASGPWRTLGGIHRAIAAEDARALARHVDFPALRASLRPQVQDRIVRAAGADAQSGRYSALGLAVATGVAGGIVDAMVTPMGLGAMMEGRKVWNRMGNVPPPSRGAPAIREASTPEASLRFESLSRASAVLVLADGSELTLVLTRRGMRWRLAGIHLPAA